jgi:YYY domain-containing protein
LKNLPIPTPLVLIAILALALILRLTGVSWDDYSRLHPDERFLTDVVSRIGNPDNLTEDARARCPDPQQVYEYFNSDCSMWNPDNIIPGSYAYGTLPLYIVHGAGKLLATFNVGGLNEQARLWHDYEYVHLVGRMVNAIADTITVFFIYLIGARVFSVKHGLLAAFLYALSVLPIQQSHYWTVDILSNLFFVIGMYAALEIAKTGRRAAYWWFGLALGCAVASRINILPMAALLPVAVAVRYQTREELVRWRQWLPTELVLVLASLCLGALTFRVAQPYAFVGPSITHWALQTRWLEEIQHVSDLSRVPSDGWPPSVQWFDRVRYAYAWYNMAMWGMGIAFGLAGTLALLGAVFAQLRRLQLSPALAVPSLWVIGYFAFTGGLHQMTMRYYLPLYPALALLAVWGIFSLPRPARRVLGAVVAVVTFVWGFAFTTTIYTQPITRVEASGWIIDNMLATVTLQNEQGQRASASVGRHQFNYRLQTAFNGESYLGDLFQMSMGQPLRGFEVYFTDPKETRVTLQLMREDQPGLQITAAQWELLTDDQGRAVVPSEALPPLSDGMYRWHILSAWDGDPAIRHFIPTMLREENGVLVRLPLAFLSPYQWVDYGVMTPEQPIAFRVEAPFTASDILLPHTLMGNDTDLLRLTLGDQQVIARPVAAAGETSPLGPLRRYVLERPLELKPENEVQMRADTTVFITGTALATEGAWEDSLPSRYCGRRPDEGLVFIRFTSQCIPQDSYGRTHFMELGLDMAETDSDVKYRRMVDILQKADYLILSSNRFYDAQPRVLRRFPMSTEYYNRLFDGNLGYSLIETFQRVPSFLGLRLPHEVLPTQDVPAWMNQWEAEEAFSVYDHPTVFILRNDDFTPSMFPVYRGATVEAASIDTRNRVSLENLPAATFQLATQPQTDGDVTRALGLWVVIFLGLGWLAYPLMFALFPLLPLRGFVIGRALAWLALAFIPWWLTSLLGTFFWTSGGLWLTVVFFAAISLAVGYRRREEMIAYVRANWRAMLFCELLFIGALAFGMLLRAVNPDLWHGARGGEKPMDFAYLNAVLRTPVFPPPNPWLAGFEINYYYFGFVIAALPIKLTRVASEIGYNLALGALYAVVFANVFTLAYSVLPVARRWARTLLALVGVLFVMVAGNLGTLKLMVAPEVNMDPHRWYWWPTRVLGESANRAGGAINEVPLFSFLFGDLHAHVIALLPTTLFLLMLVALVKQKRWWLGLILGSLAAIIYMTNTWDVLLYVPLGALAILIAAWTNSREFPLRFVTLGIAVAIGGAVTAAPYLMQSTIGQSSGIELWNFERSLLEPFVLVWGIPIGISALWLLYRGKRQFASRAGQGVAIGVLLIAIVGIVALPPEMGTSALCALLTTAALVLAVRDTPDARPVHLGVALVFAGLLAIEYVVVIGDVGRMNTVFKVSFQLWLWLGVLIPVMLYRMIRSGYYLQAALSLFLIGLGLLYPVEAIPARQLESTQPNLTLAGERFMNSLPVRDGATAAQDAEMIRYLRANVDGFPVLLEWYTREYDWNNRISVQTGLPAVTGWANHMRQQYASLHLEIDARINDVRLFYTSGNIEEMRRILRDYAVRYIVFGDLERMNSVPDTERLLQQLMAEGVLRPAYGKPESAALYEVTALVRASVTGG